MDRPKRSRLPPPSRGVPAFASEKSNQAPSTSTSHAASPAPGKGGASSSSLGGPSAGGVSAPTSAAAYAPLPFARVTAGSAQARHSAFAARIQAGTTSLMRPLPADLAGTSTAAGAGAATGRGAGERDRPRYVDHDDSDEGSESEEESSHDTALGGKMKLEEPKDLTGQPCPAGKLWLQEGKKNRQKYYHEADLARLAHAREILVPITIEFETPTHRVTDVITWNLRERLVSPLAFARTFVTDLGLDAAAYAPEVAGIITQALEEAQSLGIVWREEVKEWDAGIREEAEKTLGKRRERDEEVEEDLVRDGEEEFEDDMRVALAYETPILTSYLKDRLEWDLTSPLTPETFAAYLARDMGLSGEALPLISNAVREQLQLHRRAAFDLGLPGMGRTWNEARLLELKAKELEAAGVPSGEETRNEEGASPANPSVPLPGSSAAGAAAAAVPETPAALRQRARVMRQDINLKGPKRLEGIWHEWGSEYGPFLEHVSAEDREKALVESIKETRRSRRTAAATRTRRR